MTQKEIERVMKSIAKAILPNMIDDLYQRGIITEEDLTDSRKTMQIVKRYYEENKDTIAFETVVDHREEILKVAESEVKKGRNGLAISLYATSVEHTLNRIIHLACVAKKIDSKTQSEILRSVNINGKCTWLFRLLDIPAIKADYLKIILNISDERNAYLHYKWKPDIDMDKIPDLEKEEKINKEKIKRAKLLIKYLKGIEAKIEFRGKKSRIANVIK